MPDSIVTYPVKTREIKNTIADSTRWNYVRSATTTSSWPPTRRPARRGRSRSWSAGAGRARTARCFEASPWVDFRPVPLEIVLKAIAAQTHRRFLKTHLPRGRAACFRRKAKYLYVVRDGRDVAWSMHNHHLGFTEQIYPMFNNVFGREG